MMEIRKHCSISSTGFAEKLACMMQKLTCLMLAGLTMSRLLFRGTVLANSATAPATTGLATEVPDRPLGKKKPTIKNYEVYQYRKEILYKEQAHHR